MKLNGKHRDLISSDDVNIVLLGGSMQNVKEKTQTLSSRS